MGKLLQLARARDLPELVRALELKTRLTHNTCTRGLSLTESEKLLDEALWYERRGDLDEARYRLEQAA